MQREFVALLLPLVERKLRKTVPQILPPLRHPALLAHTIYQALSFDATLVEDGFSLEGTSRSKEGQWKGTSEVILGRREWFDAWLEGEKKCKRNTTNTHVSGVLSVTYSRR